MIGITLSNNERGNDFGICIQRDKRPNIAISTGPCRIVTLRADKSSNFVHLNLIAGQAAHFGIHDLLASLTNADTKPHDSIAVNPRDALDRTDAVTLFTNTVTVGHPFLFTNNVVIEGTNYHCAVALDVPIINGLMAATTNGVFIYFDKNREPKLIPAD